MESSGATTLPSVICQPSSDASVQWVKFTLATNNSSKSVEQFQQRLEGFGVQVEPWQIITSSHAVTDMLLKNYPARGEIFVIGENGIKNALKEKGFTVATPGETKMRLPWSLDRSRDQFSKLKEATLLIPERRAILRDEQ